ncbi:hypothetical protein ACOMHN_004181 [Nucella lapillus]
MKVVQNYWDTLYRRQKVVQNYWDTVYMRQKVVQNYWDMLYRRQKVVQNYWDTLYRRQKRDWPLGAFVTLHGLKNNSVERGIHVHEGSDMSDGCNSLGGPLRPDGADHGDPHAGHRHLGNLGNLRVRNDWWAVELLTNRNISLFGHDSIQGKSIVIHAGPDDYDQVRIACCVIVACSQDDIWTQDDTAFFKSRHI